MTPYAYILPGRHPNTGDSVVVGIVGGVGDGEGIASQFDKVVKDSP